MSITRLIIIYSLVFFLFSINALIAQESFSLKVPSGNLKTDFQKLYKGEFTFGDVDGDGDQDMISSGTKSGNGFYETPTITVDLYLNNGTGDYTIQEDSPFDKVAGYPSLADIDNDGDLDLLITGTTGYPYNIFKTTKVYLNDGSGNFSLKSDHGLPDFNERSVFIDINDDQAADVLLVGTSATLYLNNGSGEFNTSQTFTLSHDASEAKFGYLNDDEHIDLLFAGQNMGLYFNDGTGTFIQSTHTPFPNLKHASLDFGDINGDSLQDIIMIGKVVDSNTSKAQIFYNNPDSIGTFSDAHINHIFESSNTAVDRARFGYLDGDNRLDYLITGNNTTHLYFNDDSIMTRYDQVQDGPYEGDLAIVDIDGDNDMDIVFIGEFEDPLLGRVPNTATYVNQGDRIFTQNNLTDIIEVNNGATVLLDINKDGNNDLVISGNINNETIDPTLYELISKVYLNDGLGNFIEDSSQNITALSGRSQRFIGADFNKDGWVDLLATGEDDNQSPHTTLYLNNQEGLLVPNLLDIESINDPAIDTADINEDGYLDFIISGENSSGPITKLYYYDTTSLFIESDITLTGLSKSAVKFADITGNNKQDVIITGVKDNTRTTLLYQNEGNGNFVELTNPEDIIGVQRGTIAIGDVDGDNDTDFFITGFTTDESSFTIEIEAALYKNDGNGVFSKEATNFTNAAYGNSTFYDFDGDGDLDLFTGGYQDISYATATSLYENDGTGNFSKVQRFQAVADMDFTLGDIDGDDMKDLIFTGNNGSNGTRIYINNTLPCPTVYQNTDIATCDYYIFNGDTLTESGTYETTFSRGICDSIVTVNLTIGLRDTTELYITEDIGYTYEGQFYVHSGLYSFHYSNTLGCDSLVNLYLTINAFGEEFMEKITAPFAQVQSSSAQFIDFDQDSILDLMVIGKDNSDNKIAELYKNDGTGNWILTEGQPFTGITGGPNAVVIGDVNGDQYPDIFTAGVDIHNNISNQLYINDSSGNFSIKGATGIYPVNLAAGIFADFDNDNDNDLLLTGKDFGTTYNNDSTGTFDYGYYSFKNIYNYQSISSIDVGDLNGDENLDIVYTSRLNTTKIYLGDGTGDFTESPQDIFIYKNDYAMLKLGDVDGDEDLDLFVTGAIHTDGATLQAKLYLNDGNGIFTQDETNTFVGLKDGDLEFWDFDGDGDLDIIYSGQANTLGDVVTLLYQNNGLGAFELTYNGGIKYLKNGSISIADVNGDNLEDLFITGEDTTGTAFSQLYHNTSCIIEHTSISHTDTSSYVFNSDTLTTSGEFISTFININGCDSIVTLNLTIITPSTTWDGTEWTGGTPDPTLDVIIDDSTEVSSDFICKNLNIKSGKKLKIPENITITITGNIDNKGDGISGKGKILCISNDTINIEDEIAIEGILEIAEGTIIDTDNKLTLTDGGTLIHTSDDQINGEVKAERNGKHATLAYNFWSIPFTNRSEVSKVGGHHRYTFNEPLSEWQTASDTLIAGTGVIATGAGKVSCQGRPFVDSVNVDVTAQGINPTYKGYNLIGNPFLAPLDYDEFITDNPSISEGSLYLYEGNTDGTGSYTVINSLNKSTIPTFQAFFIKVDSDREIHFYHHQKKGSASTNFYRKNKVIEQLFQFTLKGADYQDHIQIAMGNEFTQNNDYGYDAFKLYGNQPLSIAIAANAGDKSIEATPVSDHLEIPLTIQSKLKSPLRLSCDEEISDQYLFSLRNLTTGVEKTFTKEIDLLELTAENQYTLIIDKVENNPLKIKEAQRLALQYTRRYLHLNYLNVGALEISVYDVFGKEIFHQQQHINTSYVQQEWDLPTHQLLFIFIQNEDEKILKKVYLK